MLEYWYRALRSERGIVIRVSDFDRARQQMYKVRTETADPDLQKLSIVQSPTAPNELWIVHKPPTAG